jgi:diguanylate cyclase (GGDEF)-like protein
MIDVDHFKGVNDHFGHGVGDQVLLALSRLLQQRLRQTDLIGRYGGEEFALVLEATEPKHALELVDRLREVFSRILFHAVPEPFTCTFSAGVAGSAEYESAEQLGEAADRALYAAKAQGRNRVLLASAVTPEDSRGTGPQAR